MLYRLQQEVEVLGAAGLAKEFLQQTDTGVGDGLGRGDGERGNLRGLEIVADEQTNILFLGR